MYFKTLLASVVLLAPTVLANPQSGESPQCIDDCATEFPTSSWCDGDETGEALAECQCQSLRGSDLLSCFYDCSDADQNDYARVLAGSCREELFPDATSDDSDDNDNNGSDEEETTSSADDGPTSTGEEEEPEETEDSSNDSGSDDDDGAAMGVDVPAALAAGGLLAAFFL